MLFCALTANSSAASAASVGALIVRRRIRHGHGAALVTRPAGVAGGPARGTGVASGRAFHRLGGLVAGAGVAGVFSRVAAAFRLAGGAHGNAVRQGHRHIALLYHASGGGSLPAGGGNGAGRRNGNGFGRGDGVGRVTALVKAGIKRVEVFRIQVVLHDAQAFTEMGNLNERPGTPNRRGFPALNLNPPTGQEAWPNPLPSPSADWWRWSHPP